jgi:hypothetical protein
MKSAGVVPIGTSEGPPSDGSGNHRIPGGGDEVVELTDDLTSITPVFGSRFTALRKDLLTPYDAAVATSSSYVLVMTNASYAFYNRSSSNSQVVPSSTLANGAIRPRTPFFSTLAVSTMISVSVGS